jgi:hypothetical protein
LAFDIVVFFVSFFVVFFMLVWDFCLNHFYFIFMSTPQDLTLRFDRLSLAVPTRVLKFHSNGKSDVRYLQLSGTNSHLIVCVWWIDV